MSNLFIGQDEQERIFLESYASGRLHHAWLLSGPKGVGKASFAKRAALFLLDQLGEETVQEEVGLFGDALPVINAPKSFDSAQGSQAQHLVEAGTHPEYHLLEPLVKEKTGELARNITIHQVRDLIQSLTGTPTIAHYRVCIVDAIDDLERSAANALLKTLEEPPRDTIFFLVSHAPGRLLPTIRSRCRSLRFAPLSDVMMSDWLAQEAPNLAETDRAALIRMAKGSPGRALETMGLELGELVAQMQRIIDEGDRGNSKRHALAKALALKAARPRYEAMLELAPELAASWCKGQQGAALTHGIATWERLRDLTQYALSGSYDVSMTGYEVGTLLAGLAHPPR